MAMTDNACDQPETISLVALELVTGGEQRSVERSDVARLRYNAYLCGREEKSWFGTTAGQQACRAADADFDRMFPR
jgi:hypothetical protein